jgi:hypothetical protein
MKHAAAINQRAVEDPGKTGRSREQRCVTIDIGCLGLSVAREVGVERA